MTKPEYMTLEQAAAYLGIDQTLLERKARGGALETHEIDGQPTIDRAALHNLLRIENERNRLLFEIGETLDEDD